MRKFLSLTLLASLAFVGCTESSDRLVRLPDDKSEKVDKPHDASGFFTPKVDILFVIDDSGSMQSHQTNLSNNVNLFVNEITANPLIDYRIGVTTTDHQTGGILISANGVLYIDQNTHNGDLLLKQRLRVGTNGSYIEQMFNPVWRAFSPPLEVTVNKGFLRPDAFLAIVFITDAEDQSEANYPNMDPQGLIQFLDGLKGPGMWFAYGAYVPPGSQTGCERDEREPYKLHSFFVLTGSPYFDLCAKDFGKNLASIGANLAKKVGRTVFLDRLPIENTIKVVFGSQEIPRDRKRGWSYDPYNNTITFGDEIELLPEPKGTMIKITFVTKVL